MRWYSKEPIEAIPVPVLGPDLIDPREYKKIKEYTQVKLAAEAEAQLAAQSEAQNAPAVPEPAAD